MYFIYKYQSIKETIKVFVLLMIAWNPIAVSCKDTQNFFSFFHGSKEYYLGDKFDRWIVMDCIGPKSGQPNWNRLLRGWKRQWCHWQSFCILQSRLRWKRQVRVRIQVQKFHRPSCPGSSQLPPRRSTLPTRPSRRNHIIHNLFHLWEDLVEDVFVNFSIEKSSVCDALGLRLATLPAHSCRSILEKHL